MARPATFIPDAPAAPSTFVPDGAEGASAQAPASFVPDKKPEVARPSIYKNAMADVQDLKTGGSALAANVMKPVASLIRIGSAAGTEEGRQRAARILDDIADQVATVGRALPEFGKATAKTFKGYARDFPRGLEQSFQEHPVNTLLDAMVVLDGMGSVARGGLRLGGEAARLAGQETIETGIRHVLAGSPSELATGAAKTTQTLSKNPIIQMAQQALIKASDKVPGVSNVLSLPGMRGIVPPGAITEDARMSLMAGREAKAATLGASAEYNRNMRDIMGKIGTLKEDERNAFTAVVEGRAVPFKMSRPFHEAMDYYKQKVLGEAQRFNLPEENAKRVAYQPLVLAAKGLYEEPLAAKVDVMGEARRGNISAIRQVYENAARGDVGARGTIADWHKEVEETRVKQAEAGMREFLGVGRGKTSASPYRPKPIIYYEPFSRGEKLGEALEGIYDDMAYRSVQPSLSVDKRLAKRLDGVLPSLLEEAEYNKLAPHLLPKWKQMATSGDLDERVAGFDAMINALHHLGFDRTAVDRESSAMASLTKPFFDRLAKRGNVIRERYAPKVLGDELLYLKRMAKDIASELTPQPIYFPHIFENKLKISDFIRLPTGLQKFRPAFLKVRAGAEGYIETNPAYALMVHEKHVQKFKSTESLINGVVEKFAEPLATAKDLKPGYKVFAPEGAFKFYRTYLNFQDQFMKGVALNKDIDQAYIEAAKSIMSSEVPADRVVVGVRRAPMYQLPRAVADKLVDELRTYNWPASIAPVMKLIYDKPLDAFRYTVLGFRPGWVLHTTAGQVVTSTLSRVNLPLAMMRAKLPEVQRAMEPVNELIEASGFRRSEMRLQGASRLQRANPVEHAISEVHRVLFSNEPVMEKASSEAARKILTYPIRAAKGFADGVFEANSRIEDMFRKAVAGDMTRKMAMEQASRETARGFFDARTAWDKFLGHGEFTEEKIVSRMKKLAESPNTRQEILDKTFRVLNNYAGLNSFERGVIRRVVPFWSWWKFVNTFAVRTAFQDPVMADLGRHLAAFGNDIEAQEWKQNGLDIAEIPIWKRGGTVMGKHEDHGKVFEIMSGRNPNPFMTLGAERINLAPYIALIMDMITGKNSRTGEPYRDPATIEVRGRLFDRIAKNQVRETKQGATPDLPSELIRRIIPPASEIEQAIHAYQFYPTDKIYGKHHPIPDERGHAEMVNVGNRLAGLLGMPISEMKKISALRDRQAQVMALKAFLKQDALRNKAQKEVDR